MTDTDRDWRIWGETDPYYGVVAAPEFRQDRVDHEYFLLTGEAYIVDRLARLERALGPVARGRALDFGCGVGRVALPMARLFDEVVGLDISPGMLAEAERLKALRGADNASFRASDDRLGTADGMYDFVHSVIVFQHIPAARGVPIIGRLLDRVASGGIANIHVAIRRDETPMRALFYRARTQVPGIQRIVHRLRGKKASEPMMQMNPYPVADLLAMLHARGFGSALIDVEQHGRFLTMHVAARRDVGEKEGGDA